MRRFLAVFFSAFLFTSLGVGQTGFPRFSSIENDGFGNINRYNLNNQFAIPIVSVSSRGFNFNPTLSYNSLIWQKYFSSWAPVVDGNGAPTWGWGNQGTIGGATFLRQRLRCVANDGTNQWSYDYSNFDYLDQAGTHHLFNLDMLLSEQSEQYPECGDGSTQGTEYAGDGSGYYLVATASGNTVQAKVYAPTGTGISDGVRSDTNGNHITSYGVSANETDWNDSTGRVALKVVSDTVSTPRTTTYSYRDASGGWQNFVVKLASYNIRTAFGCSGISEYASSPVWLPYEIDLPDTAHNGQYSIQYEATPGSSSETTGRISHVNLPAGGYISYTYGGVNCDDGSPTSLIKVMNDGSTSSTWTYTRTSGSGLWSTTVNAPNGAAGNDAVYSFNSAGFPTDVKSYQGTSGGNILQEVGTSYTTGSDGIIYAYTNTTTTGNAQTKVARGFDLYGNLTGIAEYDGSTLLRSTSFSYLGSTQYVAANIVNRLTETVVSNGGGTAVARTVNTYDDYSSVGLSCITGASGHDDSNYGCSNTVRGNLTKTVKYSSPATGTGAITTQQVAYDSLGNVVSITDANNHSTSISYADSWGSNNPCSMSATYAYPTQVTNALSQQTSATYNSCTGALTSSKDANNQTTTFTYSDALLRQTNVSYPDGGGASYSYTPTQVTTQVIGGTSSTTTTDGLGRTIHSQTAGVTVDYGYGYDSQGSTQAVSNPYQSGSAPSTTTHYDAIGRPTRIDYADGTSHSSLTYADNCTTGTDAASNSRKLCTDALGRIAQVYEDPGGSNLATTYTYNGLDKLTDVLQSGGMPRHFFYDGLGRMIAANNPENASPQQPASLSCGTSQSWTMCYGYDNNSNLTSQTDNRGLQTTYTYDSLNRLTDKTFNDGRTPGQHYGYDITSSWMGPQYNTIGRLSQAHTDQDMRYFGTGGPPTCNSQNSSTANYNPANGNPTYCNWTDELYSYDAMGRLNRIGTAFPSEAGWAAHETDLTYDLAGNMTSLRYPDGRVVTQGIDGAGHLQNVTYDNWNGQHVGYTYASAFTYTAAGAQTEVTYGNGVYIHTPYNNRQQMCQVWSQIPSQPLIDTHIYYGGSTIYCNSTPGNNGNITQIKDWRNPDHTRYFGYDALNRIASFSNGDGSMQQSYSFDAFGNLSQSGTLNFQAGTNSNNQINSSGYIYDAAGNLSSINNGSFTSTYSFDAASRIFNVNSGGAYYTYDGNGERMRKDTNGSYTEYQYLNGQPIAEKHSDGTWSDYIYANGQMIARADSFNRYIQFTGTFSSVGNYGEMNLSPASNLVNYPIRNGDQLLWKQRQFGAYGGVYFFTNGGGGTTGWTLTDQNGEYGNDSLQTDGNWHSRAVNLSSFANATINSVQLVAEGNSPAGNWTVEFADIAVLSSDGKIQPIYNGATAVSASPWGTSGYSNPSISVQSVPASVGDTVYYTGDHVGSTRMLTSDGGWPISSSTFYPFGQEQDPTADPNHYKFTGLERDQESGLDHAMFRQYSSTQGRWMSPDPYLGSMDITNPQSLNRYNYVLNNPQRYVDPLGLNEGDYWLDQFGNIWYEGAGGVLSELDTTVNVTPGSDCGFGCTTYSASDLTSTVNPIPTSDYPGGTSNHGVMIGPLPNPDPCQQKAQNIQNLRNEITGRFQDYSDNSLPLPLFGPMSRAGHIQQIGNKQTALQNALNDYRTSGCGGPSGNAGLPGDVNQVAFAPLPTLSPSRPTPRQLLVGGAAVIGGVIVTVFAPELWLFAPAF